MESNKILTTESLFELAPEIKLTDSDWRCLATIIDCEGYIFVRGVNRLFYSTIIRVKMTSEDYINYIHTLYPGRVTPWSPSKNTNKPQFAWEIQGESCRDFLKGILPFLIIKQKQAELALELLHLQREWSNQHPYPATIKRRQEEIYQEVKLLNKRGVLL